MVLVLNCLGCKMLGFGSFQIDKLGFRLGGSRAASIWDTPLNTPLRTACSTWCPLRINEGPQDITGFGQELLGFPLGITFPPNLVEGWVVNSEKCPVQARQTAKLGPEVLTLNPEP